MVNSPDKLFPHDQSELGSRSSPVQIPGTTWCDVEAGSNNILAIKTDNTLWAWGCNSNGQLGISTITHRSSPVQIPGTNWCRASASENHSMAIKCDNTLWVWGWNSSGQLGLGDVISRSSPTQIPGTDWHNFYSGSTSALFTKKV